MSAASMVTTSTWIWLAEQRSGELYGTNGFGSAFWKWGKGGTYYQDLNVQIDKKFSRSFDLHLMYMNQFYNQTIVEGRGRNGAF